MIAIEGVHTLTAHSAGHDRHAIEGGIIGHRGHRCLQITGEFRSHMLLEQIDHGLLLC